jgi:hypothetical protein
MGFQCILRFQKRFDVDILTFLAIFQKNWAIFFQSSGRPAYNLTLTNFAKPSQA